MKHIHRGQHTPASYMLDRALLDVPAEICLLSGSFQIYKCKTDNWEKGKSKL
jgi:hypothetical protein